MTFRRIPAPIHNKVGPVFDFAERARYFSAQLSGNFGRTVSQRSVAVEQAAELVRKRDAFLLGFASRIAHAIHERHVGLVQIMSRRLDGFVDRRFFAIN